MHVWGELKQSSQSHGNARLKERQRDTDDLVQQLAVEVKSLRRQIVHNDEQQCARINPLLDDFNARATSIQRSRACEDADAADSEMRALYQSIHSDHDDGSYQQLFAENPHLQVLLKRVFAQINTY